MLEPLVRFLDPRPHPSPEIADSVPIPLMELADRIHELPSRGDPVLIVGGEPWASRAMRLLEASGRPSIIAEDWSYGPAGGRLWSPNAFLREIVESRPVGCALDIGCGSGRDAVFLASRGWDVTAVDHLPDALAKGRDLQWRYAPDTNIRWLQMGLEPWGASPSFGQRFDLITMFWYLNRELVRDTPSLLAPGGMLVLETFSTTHRAEFGKPRNEAFVLRPKELIDLDLRIVHYEEGWHEGRHSVRLVADKRPS